VLKVAQVADLEVKQPILGVYQLFIKHILIFLVFLIHRASAGSGEFIALQQPFIHVIQFVICELELSFHSLLVFLFQRYGWRVGSLGGHSPGAHG